MTDRYFDPKNDVAFKKLFGTEDKKPLLMEFLNAILGLSGNREIVSLTHLLQYIYAANIAAGDAETERLKFEEGKIEGRIEENEKK